MDSIYLILFVIKSEFFVWIGIDEIALKLNSGIKSQNVNWRQWGDLTNLLLNHTDMKVTHAWKLDEKKKQTIPCSYHFVNQPFPLSFRLIIIHFFLLLIKNKFMQCAKILWTCFKQYLYYLWQFFWKKNNAFRPHNKTLTCNRLQFGTMFFVFFYKTKCFKITMKNENNLKKKVST